MKLDKYSQPIFNSQDLFQEIYENGPDFLTEAIVEKDSEIELFLNNLDIPLKTTDTIDYSVSTEWFDKHLQENWFMPQEYKDMDIEGFLVHACPKENYQRLVDELVEFKNRNMLDLLRWLKYFVDTCRKNNIIWGVGRGSSVSSYVLYLIGVHKIDSIKYNLDWQEFLR
jgi:DNA polymerase III alpha subunit